jgi:hypothetical protein
MRRAIDLVSGRLTGKRSSHKNGWAQMRACQLSEYFGDEVTVLHGGESWDDFDQVFLYHGMEFQGSLNLFGGASEESAVFYERIGKADPGKLMSLDMQMPDYGLLCKGRLKNCEPYWASVDWDRVSEICSNIPAMSGPHLEHLVIGDSHSFSAYIAGASVIRKDGRTLEGVLKKTITKEIYDQGTDPKKLNKITCYWGNIDIRHHLMREADPAGKAEMLIKEYVRQVSELGIKEVELVAPLPIEDESRRLPKSGNFQGTPFFGTRDERDTLMRFFRDELFFQCAEKGWNLFTWPEKWYTMDPVKYMDTFMEGSKSVHLSPEYHRWNYWKGEPNQIFEVESAGAYDKSSLEDLF